MQARKIVRSRNSRRHVALVRGQAVKLAARLKSFYKAVSHVQEETASDNETAGRTRFCQQFSPGFIAIIHKRH